jgi:curved DNA-binding protein CbpA
MVLPDYYAMLEVPTNASPEQIKQAYRRLARLYHPDLNRQAEDRQIKQINDAYNVLGDVTRRARYDIQRLEARKHDMMVELIMQRRKQLRDQKRMTWKQGVKGFVRELKKEMRDGK